MRDKTAWMVLSTASILMSAAAAWAQMPPPPGRLVILSDPRGAVVTINQKEMSQRTDATFVVSPGTYIVSVAAPDGSLRCGEISLSVSGGQAVRRTCSSRGWQQ